MLVASPSADRPAQGRARANPRCGGQGRRREWLVSRFTNPSAHHPGGHADMARMRALAVLFAVALTIVGCSKAEPEVDPQAQVPADQRSESGASEGGSEGGGGGGGGGATFVAVDIAFESAPESVPAGDVEITLENGG